MDVPAMVVTYDPGWPGLFKQLRDRVDAALAEVAHVTEHVGSTAVPGLDAKPVIDLDVVVPDYATVGPAIGALAAAGWRHQGDLGITGREAFVPPADAVYHHLYVVVAGSQPHRDHVDLRDFLRAHPGQAARYGELKRRLAGLLATDRVAYSDGKAEMIAGFLRQARCRTVLGERVAASAVVACPGLVLPSPAPAGPAPHAPGIRCAGLDQADQQAADLRHGVADHAGVAGTDPLFSAWARLAASQARASMDKVMWAYQARQVRTWYWSSPASFLACWKHSSMV